MYQWIISLAVSNSMDQWLSSVVWKTNSYLEYAICDQDNLFWMPIMLL